MSVPTPMAFRQTIVERYKKGEKVSALARHFKISRGTIYSFINRESADGATGLTTNYNNCGKARPKTTELIYRTVRCFRTWHPTWGAEKIRAEILQIRPELALPHYRTFTRWFHWNNQITPSLKSLLPKQKHRQATRLHEGWQIDAKEEMMIADGSKNCWLNITDEYSGTVIDPPVFP